MLKLIKYEFLKSKTAGLIVLIVAAALEIMFIVGCALSKYNTCERFGGSYEEWIKSPSYVLSQLGSTLFTISLVLLVISCFSVFLFVIIFSVIINNNDLGKKQGYNVFLTPNSSYAILGSKYITTFIIFFGLLIVGYLLISLDINVGLWAFDEEGQAVSLFDDYIRPIFEDAKLDIISFIVCFIAQIIYYIVIAGFALVFSQTIVKTGAGKFFLTLLIFIAINTLVGTLTSLPSLILTFSGSADFEYAYLISMYIGTAIYIAASGVLYYLSARTIDKKLSL